MLLTHDWHIVLQLVQVAYLRWWSKAYLYHAFLPYTWYILCLHDNLMFFTSHVEHSFGDCVNDCSTSYRKTQFNTSLSFFAVFLWHICWEASLTSLSKGFEGYRCVPNIARQRLEQIARRKCLEDYRCVPGIDSPETRNKKENGVDKYSCVPNILSPGTRQTFANKRAVVLNSF